MNNKRYTYCFLLLLPALLLFSCAQDDMPGATEGTDNSGIVFRVSLPATEARSTATTVVGDLNGGFYVSAICPEDNASTGNALDAYFTEQLAAPLEGMTGYYGMLDERSSEQWVWPTTRHGKLGKLKFFAFYPSCEAMRDSAGATTEYFRLANNSKKQGNTVTYDYRMEKFKVNKEISRHVDFVTATAEGSRKADGESGVRLNFEHQLSRVSFQAWGNTDNDIEIAGVRIGSVVTESDFNFAATPNNYAQGDNTANGKWIGTQKRDYVEYIFREGDNVVKIGSGNLHTSEATAVSIMGTGGWAMVIPADNTGWNHKTDAANKGKGIYFSVLLRVKGKDINNNLLYPYVKGEVLSGSVMTDDMTVIFLSVDRETGKVMKRLYRDKAGNYFTDPGFTKAYAKPETEEIRNYGWAAIPMTNYRWKPGYQYTYTLNYTNGVGVHDPEDPFPGSPIISTILVGVTENGTTWPMVNEYSYGDKVDVTDKITIK